MTEAEAEKRERNLERLREAYEQAPSRTGALSSHQPRIFFPTAMNSRRGPLCLGLRL